MQWEMRKPAAGGGDVSEIWMVFAPPVQLSPSEKLLYFLCIRHHSIWVSFMHLQPSHQLRIKGTATKLMFRGVPDESNKRDLPGPMSALHMWQIHYCLSSTLKNVRHIRMPPGQRPKRLKISDQWSGFQAKICCACSSLYKGEREKNTNIIFTHSHYYSQ